MPGAVQVLTTAVIPPQFFQVDAIFIKKYDINDDVDINEQSVAILLVAVNGTSIATAKRLDDFVVTLKNGAVEGLRTKSIAATQSRAAGTYLEVFTPSVQPAGYLTAFTDAITATKAANPKSALRTLLNNMSLLPAGS